MPTFLIPALQEIVARSSDVAVRGILSSGGIIANAGALAIPGLLDGSAALAAAAATAGDPAAALLTQAGTRALTAGARIGLASTAAGGGNFVGVLGTATDASSGTISQAGIQDLINRGYTVTRFNICICPNCVGALKGVGAHINVTGFNVTPPQFPPTDKLVDLIDPDAVGSVFEEAAGDLSGDALQTVEEGVEKITETALDVPVEPPGINIGLIIAIALALKNQIEAGARTFSDMVTTTLVRGNVGGASPFHNVVKGISGAFDQRLVYPILNESGAFTPSLFSMARPVSYLPSELPQIPNRENYPNGESLFIQERIKNVEQSVQGYFEIQCH
jgi:hypothetical protein